LWGRGGGEISAEGAAIVALQVNGFDLWVSEVLCSYVLVQSLFACLALASLVRPASFVNWHK